MTKRNVDLLNQLGNALESEHGDVLRGMLAEALHVVMEAEVAGLCNATYGERTAARTNQRNGYRSRPFETRMGSVELQVPKVRSGSYFPSFLEPRRRWEQAFVNVVSEAYVQGVSQRGMGAVTEALMGEQVSRSTVSRTAKKLDEAVTELREQPIEGSHPYLYLDATYLDARWARKVENVSALVAYAVGPDGKRRLLGITIGPEESEDSWAELLVQLLERGLRRRHPALCAGRDPGAGTADPGRPGLR